MRINSVNSVSFGQIYVTQDADQKETLYRHTAYGIGEGSVKDFKEKYRLANLSKRFDIKVSENGAEVSDIMKGSKTSFDAHEYSEYPNALYHILNAAINYVLVKESGTFESAEPINYKKLLK